MTSSMSNSYPILMDAARRIDKAAAALNPGENFRINASLDSAVPEPSPAPVNDPDLASHAIRDFQVEIAKALREPYSDALKSVGDFVQIMQQRITGMANAVRQSAETYRHADLKAAEHLDHVQRDMDNWKPPA